MNWYRTAAALAIVLAAAGATLSFAADPGARAAGAAPDRAKLVAKGRYLVAIHGCNDCHTPGALFGAPDLTRELSGSEVGWQGPWGVSYASNLTPDFDTGMGYWKEDDIVKALKTGVRPDGTVMKPPMPWPDLAHADDADLHAIAAYLMSLKTVAHAVPTAVPPGKTPTTPVFVIPPPSAWDAPRGGAPAGGK